VVSGSVANAIDVSEADALFAKRGEGDRLSNVRAARAAYEKQLPKAGGADRVHVVNSMNRLDFYEGLLVSSSDAKKDLYKGCLNRTETLDKGSVQYFYWRGMCLGLLSNEEGLLSALKSTGEVERMLLLGREKDSRFDGGGFDRGLAVIYLKVPLINPYGPTRSAEKALSFAERALASPAYPGEPDPETATGDYFFNAYDARAQALVALGRKDEAIATLKEAIKRIEQGDVPSGREPETTEILRDLRATLGSIQN
jgi:tetratricopeptide (TPR) repeat protein